MTSTEEIIDFCIRNSSLSWEANQLIQAQRKFYHIVDHLEPTVNGSGYNRPRLVRLTYHYVSSSESREIFLQAFFGYTQLSIGGGVDSDQDVNFNNETVEGNLRKKVNDFADYLVRHLFMPLRASGTRTPQPPSPDSPHSAVQNAQRGAEEVVRTPTRLSTLRDTCLTRDHHRCVISRRYDTREWIKRYRKDGRNAKDDDGKILDPNELSGIQVAHILPHALTKADSGTPLTPSKQAMLAILNMLDHGAPPLTIPRNALSLTHDLHGWFGCFEIYFTKVDQHQHTYRVESFYPIPPFPVTRTLDGTNKIEHPSPRLLALHRAIAHILHLSGAGDYIEKLLGDMEELVIRADGSTALGPLVTLGLDGWLGGTVGV
ncbi:hypothetical protein QBC46DRAFT_362907 [Diplogelasinospora grovesii]|uniref:HNH nuclease domain-containing protein n=1 Tax=Diplogelasinospora grovesii TaxID=303347 RepID=A0AAN6NBM4_9PEZI|nr:hypothetical protein QBC46DRAFT_362907 [Diplogelasinospora grovesii]